MYRNIQQKAPIFLRVALCMLLTLSATMQVRANEPTTIDTLNAEATTVVVTVYENNVFEKTYTAEWTRVLKGRIAGLLVQGLNFDGSTVMRIRGNNSILGNNQPLVVWNGMPLPSFSYTSASLQLGYGGYDFGSILNDLSIFDLKQATVLKSMAETTKYGSRGQNGVIEISSFNKKSINKPFILSINTGLTFEQVHNLPALQNSYGGGLGDFTQRTLSGETYNLPAYNEPESWGPKFSGQTVLPWWGISNYENGISNSYETTPWVATPNDVNTFYTWGVGWNNNVSWIWKKEKGIYRLSYSNLSRSGTMPNLKNFKNSVTWNSSNQFANDKLQLQTAALFSTHKTTGRPMLGYNGQSISFGLYQRSQRQVDFAQLKEYENADGTQRTWNRRTWYNPLPAYLDNPYWVAYKNAPEDKRQHLDATTQLSYELNNKLKLSFQSGIDFVSGSQHQQIVIGSKTNAFTADSKMTSSLFNNDLSLNWKWKNLNTTIGGTYRMDNLQHKYDYAMTNTDSIAALGNKTLTTQEASAYASIQYTIQPGLSIQSNLRNDFLNFYNQQNHWKFQNYISASANWEINESFDQNWWINPKLWVSYGESGGLPLTASYSAYQNSAHQLYNTLWDEDIFNFDLKPEKTNELEAGVRLKSRNGSIYLDFIVYDRNTKNQLMYIADTLTSSRTYLNSGKVNNRGYEINLNLIPILNSRLYWTINLNMSYNQNKVIETNTTNSSVLVGNSALGGASIEATPNLTSNYLYAYDFVYDKDGNRVVNENTGFYKRSDELVPMGNSTPEYVFGLSNTLHVKKTIFSFTFDGVMGGKYYSMTKMWGMYSGLSPNSVTPTTNGNTIREDGIIVPGVLVDENGNSRANDIRISGEEYARLFYHNYKGNSPSTTSIFDSRYITLREVSVGHTFTTQSRLLENIKVSVYGRNLWVFHLDQSDFNPETIISGEGNINNIEGAMYPGTYSFGCNLKLTFN